MPVPVDHINEERLDRWRQRLQQEHATALVLIGVGHDHKIGQLTVITCDGVSDEYLAAYLRFALEQLKP